jgi:hypothetical protein
MGALAQLFSAFGLSSAAGLNAYIPLLAVGILGRMGYLHLTGPYAILTSTTTLAILGVIALVDFVADKVPAVDHAVHAVGAFIHPIAGAILFGSQTHAIDHLPPAVGLVAGILVAGGFHATRAAVRPVATATTAGMANPILSFVEDMVALFLSLLAIFIPVVGFLFFLIMVGVLFKSWSVIRKKIAGVFSKPRPPQTI